MRKAYRNPLADTDPYAVPYLSGSAWYDFGFGPLCRRLLVKYGVPIPDPHQQPTPPPVAAVPALTRAIIEARLAECTRTICEDCGCEEYCIDYLRDCLAEMAAAPERAVGVDHEAVPMTPLGEWGRKVS